MEIKKRLSRTEVLKFVESINEKYEKNPGLTAEEWAACLSISNLIHNPGAQVFEWQENPGFYKAVK